MINPPANSIPKVVQILSQMGDIALKHLMLNQKSMDITHLWCYNGFKRMHRYNTMKFMYFMNSVSCIAIDNYGYAAKIDGADFDYTPSDILVHISSWASVIESDLKTLASLSVQFFNETGVIFEPVKCLIDMMFRQKEKLKRYSIRFAETKSPHDYHIVDDRIHAMYKEKEEAFKDGY